MFLLTWANVASPPDDVVRPVGGPDDLRGDEDDVQQVAQEEEAECRKLCYVVGQTSLFA